MEIFVGKNAGFCFGVSNAVTKTKEELNTYREADCLGELVHNPQVLTSLEQQGLHIIEDLADAKFRVIIRAHGIPKEVYEFAEENKITLVDLTCPKVLQTHAIIEEYANMGYHIIYLGMQNHPEALGAISFAESFSFVQEINDIYPVINKIKEENMSHVLLLAQTTFHMQKFKEIVSILEENLMNSCNLIIKNTICSATKARQEETEEIAKSVDFMIIIGGKNSSNTRKLYDIASQYCPTISIENETQLTLNSLQNYQKIGVMAGASTPKESIEAVVEKLRSKKESS